jgi:hypothetical protein
MNTNTANAGLYLLPKPAKTIAATPASVSGQPRSCGVRKLALVVVLIETAKATELGAENETDPGLTLQVIAAEGDWHVSATSPLNLTAEPLAARSKVMRVGWPALTLPVDGPANTNGGPTVSVNGCDVAGL